MKRLRTVPRTAAAALAGFLAIGGATRAAAPEVAEPGRQPPGERGAGPPPNAEEMRQAMEQTMIARMKRALKLTPRQEEKVLPQVRSLLRERSAFAARRRAAMSHLRALLIDETAGEAAIEKALGEVQSIDERFQDRQRGLKEAINSGLTPRQQGRLLIFEERFRRMMQRRLREAAGPAGRPGMGGGERGRGGPPGEDPDDDPDGWEEAP